MKRWINSDTSTKTERGSAAVLQTGSSWCATCRTFPLPHGQQAVLVTVTEGTLGYRFKVPGVNSAAGNGVTALTHAGVVAQAAFVQVWVREGVAAGYPLRLEGNGGGGTQPSGTHTKYAFDVYSQDQRQASDRAGARPRESLRQTACRAPTATAGDEHTHEHTHESARDPTETNSC